MPLKRKGSQFANIEYRYVDHSPTHKQVLARNVDNEQIVGLLKLDDHLRDRGGAGLGLGVGLVYTSPEVRGQGVAGAMYNIAHNQLGYQPMHDNVRSPAGNRFAKNVGGPFHPTTNMEKPMMQSWELDDPSEMHDKQAANWELGTPIDQATAAALTPQKPKVRRKSKKDGVQMEFPQTEGKHYGELRLKGD